MTFHKFRSHAASTHCSTRQNGNRQLTKEPKLTEESRGKWQLDGTQTKVHECHTWSSSFPFLTKNSLIFSAMEKRPCQMPYWFHAWLHCKASVQVIKSPRKNERHVVWSAKACPQTARHHKGKSWERRKKVLSAVGFLKKCSKDWNNCVTKMDHGRNALN